VEMAFYRPTGYILNPRDWETIQLTKTTGTASSGQYIFANPHTVQTPSIWGLPVVATQAMTQGQFLVGAFDIGATIWDRWDATIEVSTDYSDYFVKNLVAILCEERLALTVYNALAFVYGGFPFGS
jgi:HK97 family phage major capsid protein